MSEIRLKGLEKSFGDTKVVRCIDLTISDGEFFTFVGPSGSGKSTILNLIAGLEEIDHGTITFDGETVNDITPGERDVAMVFQSYALYPHMSVYDNIAFPLRIRKEPPEAIDREVRNAAGMLGLEDLLGRRPAALSGGQRQRVALGRAIVRRPRVFLMDEPLSSLDAALRIEMRAEIKRLHREYGTTTVYVTHDQEEALALSDRIAVLHHGSIQQCGRSMEVYSDPASLFVALFIGTPPMNLVDGARLGESSPFDSVLHGLDRDSVLIGIRPADLAVYGWERRDTLTCEVGLLEPTGRELWVDAQWRDMPIKGRAMPGEAISPGKKAFFQVRPEAVHLFDKETGSRIRSGG
jgi:multiple sugar transport system ATP-binding protein